MCSVFSEAAHSGHFSLHVKFSSCNNWVLLISSLSHTVSLELYQPLIILTPVTLGYKVLNMINTR